MIDFKKFKFSSFTAPVSVLALAVPVADYKSRFTASGKFNFSGKLKFKLPMTASGA